MEWRCVIWVFLVIGSVVPRFGALDFDYSSPMDCSRLVVSCLVWWIIVLGGWIDSSDKWCLLSSEHASLSVCLGLPIGQLWGADSAVGFCGCIIGVTESIFIGAVLSIILCSLLALHLPSAPLGFVINIGIRCCYLLLWAFWEVCLSGPLYHCGGREVWMGFSVCVIILCAYVVYCVYPELYFFWFVALHVRYFFAVRCRCCGISLGLGDFTFVLCASDPRPNVKCNFTLRVGCIYAYHTFVARVWFGKYSFHSKISTYVLKQPDSMVQCLTVTIFGLSI